MRGVINNRERRRQILDCKDLRWRNITPTDCDLCIEFGNKHFVFVEVKYGDAEVPLGQRLCLERIVDRISETDAIACAIVARHNVKDCSEDVDASLCLVSDVYFCGRWSRDRYGELKNVVDMFLEVKT